MSPKDHLHQLIDALPDDRVLEAERLVSQLLRTDPDFGKPRPGKSFEEALDYTNQHFGNALKRLAE
jgi:hypothetical protein